jgi:ubiquinone/menaquinone biosynthesis C-methylase UbiE
LGLSVIPDWEKVLEQLIQLLNKDGKIIVVDVYAEKRDLNTSIVEWVSKADLNRKIWQEIEKKTNNFYYEYLPVKERKVGGKLFVAQGIKKMM